MVRKDEWKGRDDFMRCKRCIFYVPKEPLNVHANDSYTMVGRCRRHSPVCQSGYPVVFPNDWCGDFKLDENKI